MELCQVDGSGRVRPGEKDELYGMFRSETISIGEWTTGAPVSKYFIFGF